LRRRMRLEQEALADAAAVEVTSRQRYAEQLVACARDMSVRPAVRLSAAVGLWEGPSQLRQRIALLVDEQFTVLRSCPRRWRRAVASLVILSAILLSAITVQPATSTDTNGDQAAPTSNSPESAKGKETAAPTGTATFVRFGAPGTPNTIAGQCVDENGNPLANIDVQLARVGWRDAKREEIARQVTGANGQFRFEDVVDIESTYPDGKVPLLSNSGAPGFQVSAIAPGRVSTSEPTSQNRVAQHGSEIRLTMPPAATLRGRITGPRGEPVAGALVSVGFSQLDRWE
jgi:protocatechuate 3,4-dioxygenase beta subunit